jgi:hypothetical protein
MRKFIFIFIGILILGVIGYFTIIYYATYSDGLRSGELIKFSHKGMLFKTWEGELSQGLSGNKIFTFSVLDSDEKVINELKELQGQYVKVTYIERYRTFPWWGDTKYYVTAAVKEKSPIFSK